MQNWELLPIAEIQKSSCNQRFELDELNVQRLCQALRTGNQLPPIIVRKEGVHWGCIDGFHRLEAHKRCGYKQIWTNKVVCSDIEAILTSHGTGLVAVWTDGEKCGTYARLYRLGASLDDAKRRFGDADKKQGTIERYIVVGACLHPDLLPRVKSGGLEGSISLDVAVILSNLNHDAQIQFWNSGHCSSKTSATTLYKSIWGKSPSTATTLFKRIQTPPQRQASSVQVHQTRIASIDPLVEQIKAYAVAERTTVKEVISLICTKIISDL